MWIIYIQGYLNLWGLIDQNGKLTLEELILEDGAFTLTTEDIAKFGVFYIQEGKWNGNQLLSSDWIQMATSKTSL